MDSFTPDDAAMKVKEKEISTLLSSAIARASSVDPALLIGTFVRLTPPSNPPMAMGLLTMANLGRGGGLTRKPGNIVLNWRRLFEVVPDTMIAGAAGAAEPWLVPFAALYIWMKLWKASTIELEEKDALLVYVLWVNRNPKNKISEDEAFAELINTIRKHGLPEMRRHDFGNSLNKLLHLDCVEMQDGVIWLREWVRIRYN